jgi:hypothetical protein
MSKKRNDYNKIFLKAVEISRFSENIALVTGPFYSNKIELKQVKCGFFLSTVFAILPYLQHPHLLSSCSESQEVLIPAPAP